MEQISCASAPLTRRAVLCGNETPQILPPNQNGRPTGPEVITFATRSTPHKNLGGGVGRKAASTNETVFASGPTREDSAGGGTHLRGENEKQDKDTTCGRKNFLFQQINETT